MTQQVVIKSYDYLSKLVFSDLVDREGEIYVKVTFESPFLQASQVVYLFTDGRGLGFLFDEVANEWKGWNSKKEWSTIENDLKLVFSNDGLGHVIIDVYMSQNEEQDPWSIKSLLRLEANQLEPIAQSMHRFFE